MWGRSQRLNPFYKQEVGDMEGMLPGRPHRVWLSFKTTSSYAACFQGEVGAGACQVMEGWPTFNLQPQ